MESARRLRERFRAEYGREPRLFRAPGRVNLIGEHTDYNAGFVLPAALDLSTWVAAAPRTDRRLRVRSLHMDGAAEFDLDDPRPEPSRDWSDYVRGVALMLARDGHRLVGADLTIDSDLPLGAGLSSSAALEVSVGFALLQLAGDTVDFAKLARACQRAENEFVGMRCGIMDQFIACKGAAGHALLIDCRSLDSRLVPIDPSARLVVCNTMVRHELAGSEYNLRRQDCETGVALLSRTLPRIAALRDVTLAQLEANKRSLSDQVYRRCRHVVGENARVLAAVAALEAGDLDRCGRLMSESHASLRDDYEVSCRELDLMVNLAAGVSGVFGARMTGGGFGGCTVSLVAASAVERFRAAVARAYRDATGLDPKIFVATPAAGVAAAA